jgi:uncharacterized protein (DUF3084 family)
MKLQTTIKVNEYADNVPLKTMINYGYNHDDKWVQRMAEIIELCLDNVKNCKGVDDIEEYFEEHRRELSEAKVEADYAEQDKEEAELEAEKWRDRYNSTKYDSDYTLRATVEEALKGQVYSLSEQVKEEQKMNKILRGNYQALEKEHKYLQEKYNTWTALAT